MQRPNHSTARPAKSSMTVLVVEDMADLLAALVVLLQSDGYRVVSATEGETVLRVAIEEHADLIVMDHRIPRKSGAEVAEVLQRSCAVHPRIVMHTATPEEEIRRTRDGHDDFLKTPCAARLQVGALGICSPKDSDQDRSLLR